MTEFRNLSNGMFSISIVLLLLLVFVCQLDYIVLRGNHIHRKVRHSSFYLNAHSKV